MVDDGANRRIIVRRAVLALTAAAALLASFANPAVQAQSIMRTPNLNIAPRLPRINPNVGARVNPTGVTRINPTITGRTVSISKTTSFRSVPRIGVRSTLPYARYSPNLYPPCSDGYRDGGCWDQSGSSAGGGGGGGGGGGASSAKSVNNIPRRGVSQTALDLRPIANELVAEIALSDAQDDELARSH